MNAFKVVLFVLLAANTVFFTVAGTPSKAIDSIAWLTLLILFEAETGFAHRLTTERRRVGVRAARVIAAAGVIAATIGYVFEENVLDAANSVLWIGVILMLELEIRCPALVARGRIAFGALALAVYGGLGVLVVMWAVRGLWVDAYDAVLWLVAFATIELDILRRVGKKADPVAA